MIVILSRVYNLLLIYNVFFSNLLHLIYILFIFSQFYLCYIGKDISLNAFFILFYIYEIKFYFLLFKISNLVY